MQTLQEVYQWKCVPKSRSKQINPRKSTTINRLLAIGNSSDVATEERFSEVYCSISNEWKNFQNILNGERIGSNSIILDGDLFVFGGKNNTKSVSLN